MSDGSFARVRELFDLAVDLSPEAQAKLLDDRCADDSGLRAQLEKMLGGHRSSVGFLAQPAGKIDLTELASVGEPMIGKTFGQYTIRDVLGRGGMGVVYLAEQDRPRRTVALKLIRSSYFAPALLRRFEHEAQILGRLKHPGIAQIYDAGTAPGPDGQPQPFFAMELVRGKPLTEHVKSENMSTRDRLALFVRVCEAVHHAHQRGVIHRDLKPGNILVEKEGTEAPTSEVTKEAGSPSTTSPRPSGPSCLPKILDFGVARVTDSDIAVTTMQTSVGQVIGTLQYMSPEQARGESDRVDVRSDVYSLGVVLYELLSGKLPYDVSKRPVTEAARVIAELDATMLRTVDRSFRGDVETIVQKAMEKDPDRRYQSVADLGADIRRYLGDLPIVARPASTVYQIGKFARRNKVLVGGVVAVMLALLVGVVGTSVGLFRARRAERLAQREAGEARTQEARARRTLEFVRHVISASDVRLTGGKNWSMGDLLGELAARAESELADDPHVARAVYDMIGSSYMAISDLDRAQAFIDRAEKIGLERFGEKSIAHVETLNSRIRLERERGNFARAIEISKRQAELLEEVPGVTNKERALGLASLAEIQVANREIGAAEAPLRRALELIGTDQENARYRLSIQTILGEALWLKGDLAESEAVVRASLEEAIQYYGERHPDVALIKMALARALQHGGKNAEAIDLLRSAHATLHAVYPPGHRLWSLAAESLAFALTQGGKLDEAEPIAQEALERAEAMRPPDDRELLRALGLKANILFQRRDYANEEPIQRRRLELARRLDGESHFSTRSLQLVLAQCLMNQRRMDSAGDILRPLLDVQLDAKSDSTRLDALLLAARWLDEVGEKAQAEATFARTAALAEAMPATPTKQLQVSRRYAAWLEVQHRAADADAELRKVQGLLSARHGAEHQSVKSVAKDLEALQKRRMSAQEPAPADGR